MNQTNDPKLVRLQKIMSERGVASRRESEKLILDGAVRVNGVVVRELGTKADPQKDTIEIDRNVLQKKEAEKMVIALFKPPGYVSSTKTTEVEKKLVFDLLPKNLPRLFPVGRLDKDTSGLLILTNDGELAYRLTHPGFEHSKTYHALLQKPVGDEALKKIRRGDIRILGQKIRPAEAKILGGARVEVCLKEGKNRQIRRMFRVLGSGVKKLRRVAIGMLRLDNLRIEEGEWKKLSPPEIALLFK